MSGHKSEKKGPNIICRVSNVTPEMVCRYVERLPKQKMTEDAFRNYMGKRWFQNEHQAPEQWGLYYIDGTNYYPRFNHDITIEEADAYLYNWMRNLIVVNPYTRFKKQSDKKLVESIVSQLEKNPYEHDLKTIIRKIIDSEEPFVINEIIVNALNNYSRALKVEIINKDEERYNVSLLPNYKELLKSKNNMTKKEFFELFDGVKTPFDPNAPLQKIFYGAPGTGKSNEIKRLTGDGTFSKNYTFRTTFHPDFDYSTFVGAYKPIWDEEKGKIVYDFRPQTFLKAYVAAWTHRSENVALVIEEINRGNCAQIFGDIFQLLDRENDGLSKYPIESDIDMKGFLSSAFSGDIEEPWAGNISEDDKDRINEYYSKHYDDAFAKIKSGEILSLPKNLSILASMNTSDQSLFPMDSAFKRRWEWQYMPIKNENKNWKIQLDKDYENIDWWDFLQRINNVISVLTTSEDKQLGYFFCQPNEFVSLEHAPDAEPDLISAKRFVDKVIFYLWNDVFKEYAFDAKCCKDNDGNVVLFAKFYNEDGKSVNIEILKHFFKQLEVDKKPSLVVAKSTADTSETEKEVAETHSADEAPGTTDDVSDEAESSIPETTGE